MLRNLTSSAITEACAQKAGPRQNSMNASSRIHLHKQPPHYSIRKDLGFWQITFEGQPATLKHEQGAFYVAFLLLHPPDQPIHGLALALRTRAFYFLRPAAQTDTSIDGPVQQRSLALDDAVALHALRRKQLELEAILDDDDQIEPVKAEALRELEQIYAFQEKHPAQARDTAQKAVHAVRTAILRFHGHLAKALAADGAPHPVLRPFAAHLEQYLLVPSGRCSKSRSRLRAGLSGCFTYEPPSGVVWRAV
jgi:hypothetical protein